MSVVVPSDQTSAAEERTSGLFESVLGERWPSLPASIQRLHTFKNVECFAGRARVTRGTGLVARLGAKLFRLPPAGDDMAVKITKRRLPRGEAWERDFDGHVFRSSLVPSDRPFHIRERIGPLSCELELDAAPDGLSLPVRRGWLFGLPLPKRLLPVSRSREFDRNGDFHFDIGLYTPLSGHLIVRYQGFARPREARD
jgi:hypothetical protein